jgi:Cu-Zn family superoxide dismutase
MLSKMKLSLMAASLITGIAQAQTLELHFVDASGNLGSAGKVTLEDTAYGLLITPDLTGLPAGVHGFHVHANPSCAPAANNGVASRWAPEGTGTRKNQAHIWGRMAKDIKAIYQRCT